MPFTPGLGRTETGLCLGALSLLSTNTAWDGWSAGEGVRPAAAMAGGAVQLASHPALEFFYVEYRVIFGIGVAAVTFSLALALADVPLGKGDRVNLLG